MRKESCLILAVVISAVLSTVSIADKQNSTIPADKSAGQNQSNKATSASSLKLKTPEPKTAAEHNNRGVELGTKGLWEQAISEHECAMLQEPINKTFRINLLAAHLRYGNMLLKKNDYTHAEEQFRSALSFDPDNQVAKERLTVCQRLQRAASFKWPYSTRTDGAAKDVKKP